MLPPFEKREALIIAYMVFAAFMLAWLLRGLIDAFTFSSEVDQIDNYWRRRLLDARSDIPPITIEGKVNDRSDAS